MPTAQSTKKITSTMKWGINLSMLIISFAAFSQGTAKEQMQIDMKDMMKNVTERSKVAITCTRLANAAIYAHSQGQLPNVVGEIAKIREKGSSDDVFFNKFIKNFNLDPKDEILFSAFFLSQLNIAWLEEEKPYSREAQSMYAGYLAASCARLVKFSNTP